MGYKLNTLMREDQIAGSIKSAEEQYHRQTLEAAIDKETSARESVDAEIKADVEQLFNNLSDEIVLRAQDDLNVKNELQAAIDSETAIRSAQDLTLQRNIDAEKSARVAAVNQLKADYISADSALLDQINNDYNPQFAALSTALHNEQTLSANRHATLAGDLTASINAEKSARSTADSNLQSSLSSEISTRKSQTDSLGAAVTKEIADRTAAVNNLQSNLSTAIGNEATTRASADSALQSSIATAQSNLNTAINKEATTRASADSALQSSIATAQSNLNTAINKEATTRAAAVTSLQNSISSAVNNIQSTIKDFTPSTTTKDGTAGFVPAPPRKKSEDEILVLTSDGFQTLAESNIFIGAIPSQNGEPQYTGSVISPQWLNYEDQKMSIGGTTSATNAGTYTATFTPTGLYCWTDGTRTAKNVQWRILPKVITIPTASTTEFTYSGSAISLTVNNPNSDCTSQTGTVSATNAANYTATYKLKSTTNYIWSDGSTTDKSINWEIKPKSVTIPTASTTEFTYSGSAVSLTVNNPNSDCTSQTGTVSATNAGNYTATYKLKSTTNYIWSDDTTTDKSINWKIKPKSVTIPTAAVTQFEYTGDTITLSVTNPNSDCINVSGATWAVNAGSYTATYKLKSTTNYIWSDDTTTDKSINWKINAKKLAKPTASTTSFTYNKSSQGLTVSNYDSNYMTKTGTDTAVAAASYSVTFALKNTTNTTWSDGSTSNVVISWSIAVLKLTKPSASTIAFTYDGKSKTLSVSNFNSNYESLSGSTSEINAGTFQAVYSLNDTTNTKWADNSTANVVISWSIARQKLSATLSTFSQNGTLTYNGNSQSVSITNYNSTYHDLSSTTSATNAGTYTAKVTPKSNFAWSDGTFAAKSVSWSIGIYKLDKPTAAATEFEYTGATFTLDISNFNANYMNRTGTYSASAEGDYSVTFTLKDTSNFNWKDNTSTAVVINWKIKTNKLAKPTISAGASQEYNGNTLKPTIADYNSERMTQSGTASAVNVGSYSITYTLKDKTNTTWSDGSTDDIVLNWQITRKKLTAAQSTFSQSGTLTYTGNAQSVTISGYNSNYHDLSSTTSATNAGTYTAKVTPKSNFAWSDGTFAAKSVSWSIGAKSLSKPTAATISFEYDGAVKTLSISNYNSSYMTKSGTDSASVKGNYEVTFTLNDTNNYCWADNTTSPVSINWSIGAKAITKPTISGDSTFTYDGTAKTLNVTGYDSDTMTLSGTISSTNAADYTVTFTLRDKTNTCWQGGDTSNVSLNWTINRAKLSAELSTGFAIEGENHFEINVLGVSGTGSYYPNDGSNGIKITNYNSQYHVLKNATRNAVDWSWSKPIGNYTAELTPADNYVWSDGTRTAKNFEWYTTPMLLIKPSAQTSFEYDGNTKNLNITLHYKNFPDKKVLVNGTSWASTSNVYAAVIKSGVESATAAGSYSVTFSLASTYKNFSNKGFVWDDGTIDNITINWEITAKKMTKPTMPTTSYTWTGSNISPTVNNYDSTWIEKTGTDTATAAGTYSVTYALKDKTNTTWADGSTDDIVLNWTINKRTLTKPTLTNTSYTYDGASHAPTINNFNSTYMTKTGTESAKEFSTNTITFALKDKNNCVWSDNSTADFSLSWTINKRTLTKPTLTNTTFTYDGTAHSPTINDYNSTYESQTGTASSTDAGNFTLTYSLKNKTSTQWADGTTDDIILTWVINKATPVLSLAFDYPENYPSCTTDTIIFTRPYNYDDQYGSGVSGVTINITKPDTLGNISVSCDDDYVVASLLNNNSLQIICNAPCKGTVTITATALSANYNNVTKTIAFQGCFKAPISTKVTGKYIMMTCAQAKKLLQLGWGHAVFDEVVGAAFNENFNVDFSSMGTFSTGSGIDSIQVAQMRLMHVEDKKIFIEFERYWNDGNDSNKRGFIDECYANNLSYDLSTQTFNAKREAILRTAFYNQIPSSIRDTMVTVTNRTYLIHTSNNDVTYSNVTASISLLGIFDIFSESEIDNLFGNKDFLTWNSAAISSSINRYYQFDYFANGNTKKYFNALMLNNYERGGHILLRDRSNNDKVLVNDCGTYTFNIVEEEIIRPRALVFVGCIG